MIMMHAVVGGSGVVLTTWDSLACAQCMVQGRSGISPLLKQIKFLAQYVHATLSTIIHVVINEHKQYFHSPLSAEMQGNTMLYSPVCHVLVILLSWTYAALFLVVNAALH